VPFADVNGQRLYYEDSGGDGPPVLLSHGFLMDHEMFIPQVADLSDVYRVITWDGRGFGATEFDGEPFTYWDSARDAFGLLDHLGIERAVFGGMSQGGYVSLRAALLHPDRVRALILIDTQAPPEAPDKVEEYRIMVETWVANGYLEELASVVAGLIIGDPDIEPRWKAKWQSWDPSRLEAAGGALLDRDDISDRLAELAMPVLLRARHARTARSPCLAPTRSATPSTTAAGSSRSRARATRPSLTHPDLVNPAGWIIAEVGVAHRGVPQQPLVDARRRRSPGSARGRTGPVGEPEPHRPVGVLEPGMTRVRACPRSPPSQTSSVSATMS
jgi:3-oxoadipate enol-lactonase